MTKMIKKMLLLLVALLPMATMAQSYQSVPYSQNFEGLSTGSQPAGWVAYQTGTNINVTFPCAYAYSGNARNSSVYYEFEFASGSTTRSEIVATCEFANPSALMVDMYLQTTTDNYPDYFEVGVMEDTVFVPVDTVDIARSSGFSGSNYSAYRVYLVNYTGDGHRIAFRATRTTSGQMTVFMEDVTVSFAPSCAYMPGAPVATVDSVSATLTWPDATTTAGYMLYLNNDETWYNTSTNSQSFYGLTPNTLYTGYLYNTCSGADTSEAVPFSFRTACGMPVYPIVDDFNGYTESFPPCWNACEPRNQYPQLSTSAGRNGGKGMELYSSSTNVGFASPFLYRPVNSVEAKFWAKKSSNYYDLNLAVGYATSLSSMDSVVWVDTIAVSDSWNEYMVSFANVDETADGYIVWRKVGGSYAYLYVDDITIREVRNCALPYNFHATGTAAGQQSFAWADTVGTAWQIAYGSVGMDPDTCTSVQYFTADTATVTGLEDTITYDFYLRSDCGGEYSYWVGPVTARPNLIVMRANQRDTIRTCGGTIVDDGGLDGNFATNQSSRLYIYPSEPGKTVNISGFATTVGTYTYGTNTLTIYEGIGSSGRVLGTYANTTNAAVNVASTIGPMTLKFESSYYAGQGFELTVNCTDLANCVDPYNVEVSDVAGASALVSWEYSDATPAQSFTVTVTDTLNGNSTSYTVADTTHSLLISGLTQTTTYYVAVEANCSSSDVSNPVGTYFTTVCYVGGTVDVGTGDASLNHIINTYYNYSICQMLFTADELMDLRDSVFGIEFTVNSATSAAVPLDIYLDTTSVNSYASGSSYIPMDSANLVWSGSVVLQPGVNTFNFPTAFIRSDMTSNLVLTLDNNTGSYTSQSYIVGTGSVSGKTLYAYSDGTNYDPLGTLSLNTTGNRANISFLSPCGDASCVAPSVALGGSGATSVTLNWVPGMSENEWTVEYKLASDTSWTVAVASTNAQTATINGLAANTLYTFRVGSLCAVGGEVPYSYFNARTACDVMMRSTLPYVENFDTYTTTGTVPNCWITPATGSSGSGVFPCCYNYSSNAHSGNVYFELEAESGGTEIFALPAFDTVDGLSFEFYIATTSYYAPDVLELGVYVNDIDFVVLDTIDVSDCSSLYTYVRKDYRIHYTGNDARVAIRAQKGSRYTVFMDDFRLYVPNACDSVRSITVDSATTNSIAIHWTDTNYTGSYTVKIATSNNAGNAFFTTTTTATNYTFTGLSASTKYYIFVYANCVSGMSDENMISANTLCDVVTAFPFTEDFEDFQAGSASSDPTQLCWNRGTNYAYTTYANYPYIYSYYNHTAGGSNSMYFYSSGSEYSWLALPAMNDLDTLVLSFYMLGTSPSYYTYQAVVGVMSDQNDISTFVALDSVTYTQDGSNWQRFKVGLGGAPDTCHYICVMDRNSNYNTFFLDDISVNYNTGCTDPQNFVMTMVGQSSATVAWTDTASTGSYLVKIATSANESSAFFTDTCTTTDYTFTGLTGVTHYYVWIYTLCTNGLSDVLAGDFTTLAADPHFLPYNNDFESSNDFVVYQRSGSNTWFTGSAVNHGGNNAMYVTNDGGTTNAYTNTNQSISFAVTYLQIPFDSTYLISYDWRCQGEGSYDLMRVALAPEDYDFNNAFTAVNRYSNTLPTGWIALDGGKRNLRNTWQYDEHTVTLPAGNYYLTIVWTNDGAMGSNPAAAIDNIHMSLVTCPAPQNLTAIATSATSIDVDWEDGAATSWLVEYGAAGFPADMGTFVATTTSNVTLSGLAATTAYDIYVRPICSATDTGFAAYVNCLTGCNEVITEFPWVEDFENGIDCWSQQYTHGHVAWTTGRGGNAYGGLNGAATGDYNARFTCNGYNGYTTYLVTPQLSIESDDDVMMTFYHAQPAWGSDQDTLAVMYRVSPDSAWHYLRSWNNSITAWQSDTVMLPNTTSTYQVAFLAHSGYGLGILLDSIVVYGSESCTRPAFTNVNVGSTSIAATWNSPASAFEVAIRTPEMAWPEPVRVTTHNYVFSNLEPSTYYEYRVRSLCSDTSVSFWATSHAVTDTLECYVVEGLQVVESTFQDVTITWNADLSGHAVAYVVSVSNSAFSSSDTVYSNTATIGNLYPGVTYGVTVQSMCSATTYSDWSETINFTTPSCTPVSNVTVSDITTNSAVVDWTPEGEEDTWIVSWGYQGFSSGAGSSATVNSHPFTITGLEDESVYDVYVRPVCTDEVFGVWSDVVNFTTPALTGIEDVVMGDFSCSIYPNPTSTEATISVAGVNGKVQIVVVDMNGRTMSEETLQCDADCQKQLTVSGLAQGTYFIRIISNEVSLVRKLVVR